MTIAKIASTDPDKDFIKTGKNGKLSAFYQTDFQYTTLGKFIIYRLIHDRDVKILITGKGKTTGTGKTTLAIHLAHYVNWVRNELFGMDTEWQSKEYSFMNVWEYLQAYETADPGDPLITDELEYMADRRDHQTHENKKFSQAWSVLRYKNAVTIGTAPGLSDLEKRIPEGADIWINVVHKGRANVYYLTVNDFTLKRIFKRMKLGKFRESILWNPIEDSEDYQYLKGKKQDLGVPGISDPGSNQIDESDLNELEKNIRNSYVEDTMLLLKELGFYDPDLGQFEGITQTKIGELAGVSQSQVSNIKKELVKAGKL